jgi:magnesium transporter
VIGAIFGSALLFNLFIATLIGTIIPLILRRLKLDPALASGMLVTMLTDVMGLLAFLGLATIIMM